MELVLLKSGKSIPANSVLRPLNPFVDEHGIIRLCGRESNSHLSLSQRYPAILKGSHQFTRLLINYEHRRLLHIGPTALIASLNQRFHIIGICKSVRSITCKCITCRCQTVRSLPQKMGKLPLERIKPSHPGTVFATVGVDYAGPVCRSYKGQRWSNT